jgi:glycosyltransferase involved in cell wall biosynthesis
MTRPRVSVIIPTYNHAACVTEAIESALEQTYPPTEILVIDDGSTDETRSVLEPYASRIRYLSQDNRGAGAARNLGIRHATGELLAFLDADDRWMPDKLAVQVARLAARPAAALVHADVLLWDPPRGIHEPPRRPRRHVFDGRCYTTLFWGSGLCVSSVVVRRASLEPVGLFDETIPGASAQDYDLWWRLAQRFEFTYIDRPLAFYRIRPAHETRTAQRLQDELYVVYKRLRADPGLRALVGRRAVRRRLFRLWCDLGYLRLDAGELPEARRAFARAIAQRPALLRLWLLWCALLLPPRTVSRLRHAKRRRASGTSAGHPGSERREPAP